MLWKHTLGFTKCNQGAEGKIDIQRITCSLAWKIRANVIFFPYLIIPSITSLRFSLLSQQISSTIIIKTYLGISIRENYHFDAEYI